MTESLGPGSTFAGYRIESLVGRGGMGVVYQATDLSLDRPVALKLVAPELADDPRFRARFLDEPRLAASLDHASVIPIYEAGEHDGQLYLAMRYVPGSDLRTLLERDGALAPERALAILGQIAGALDAAHRQALVHRDVKPANVLLDEDEHAYLTDFGVTKQLNDDTNDAGTGTLDYLAPEQIRGEPVDGRTDGYALACMLYECLAGWSPFRRQTAAETMWAHLREDPPSLESHPALDPVLERALAQEREERYPTCGALIDAARDVLAPTPRRRARTPIVAGVALIAVAVAAALLTRSPNQEGAAAKAPEGNGIAVIKPSSERIDAFVQSARSPSNIAVGAGGIWFLHAEDGTVSRIDSDTKAVSGRFEAPGVPTDLAVGAGAVWVGTGGGNGGNWTDTVYRIDPKTTLITQTAELANNSGDRGDLNGGFTQIAVGAGGVWATGGGPVSHIDPRAGAVVATIDAAASRIAAGREGVWFISLRNAGVVTPIDPKTDTVGKPIRIGEVALSGIAVGGGSIWVTAEQEGIVWRITPGKGMQPIEAGSGVNYIAYGAGAAWVANSLEGTLSRIDPATNEVVAKTPIGAVQALTAGAGAAWVSTAGATHEGTLPGSACTNEGGGPRPDVLIASDLPLHGIRGGSSVVPLKMADAVRTVLSQHGFRAGRYTVGYRSCDDSTAQAGAYEPRRCAANANAYAAADRLVAVIGPQNSGCASVEIPILNRAAGGPLAMISPANTDTGLTRPGTPPPFSYRGTPDIYYPIGTRHYVRLVPPDSIQGAAHAVLAKQLGLDRVYVLDDGLGYWKTVLADPFRQTARKLGVGIAGSATFDPDGLKFDVLARAVERSGTDGVVVGGTPFPPTLRLIKALRARLGERVPIMVGSEFSSSTFTSDLFDVAGPAARGLYVTTVDASRTVAPITPAARRMARDVAAKWAGVLESAQAAEVVLRAIARSDGSRASVLAQLQATRVKDGVLGTFRFDPNGDMTPGWVPILRITKPADGIAAFLDGAVLERVVRLPTSVLD